MKRQIDQTEVYVTPVIFGAWAIGGWMWGGTEEIDAIAAIQASLDHGINTIDTAAIYGMGFSEELVGKAIKGRRDKVVIATKCGMRWDSPTGSDPWPQKDLQGNPITIRKNSSPASIIKECEDSLKRLNTDYIDLYQIHWPDSSTPLEDSWQALISLKNQGKVRAIGVSNYSLAQLKIIHAIHPVHSIQPPFSLIRRSIESDLLPFCIQNNISVLAYSPLERGLLTGKFSPDQTFPPGDHRANHPMYTPQNISQINSLLASLTPLTDKYRCTLSQLIIKSTFSIPGITAAIVGARNPIQAIENARSITLPLTPGDRQTVVSTLGQFSSQALNA